MTVPDQRHINQVSEALWRLPGEGASVVIGSGFSRNARGVRPSSKPLSMLDDIAMDLYSSLYPDDCAAEKIPQERILRLAQAYEAEFGPTALHESLKQVVRDDDGEDGSEDARDVVRDLVLKGLGYLAEELRYDREDPLDEKLDVPVARWRSIQVARAMAGQGLGGHPVVKRWLQLEWMTRYRKYDMSLSGGGAVRPWWTWAVAMDEMSLRMRKRPMRRNRSDVEGLLDRLEELPAYIGGGDLPTQRSILEYKSNENEGRTK